MMEYENERNRRLSYALNQLVDECYGRAVDAGWHHDLETGQPKKRNVGEALCLIHSEISEAMEGHRKGLMDDHLPTRPMIEVELADAIIRIGDLVGYLNNSEGEPDMDLGGAVIDKLVYNAERADHKIENRKQDGGKTY